MKTRVLGLISLLVAGALMLSGCNNQTSEENANEEVVNEAKEYCINNGGTHEIVTSDTAVYGECTLPDGTVCEDWDYFEGKCPVVVEQEDLLTIEDLDSIDENHFPKSYTYESYNMDTEEKIDAGEFVYPENFSHTILVPEHATMASREVVSSSIEDGMIYADTKVTLQNDTEISILYIVNPETLEYVAVTVTNGSISTNYQFSY